MLRNIARFITTFFTVLIISLIFQLTEMTPSQTTTLSNTVRDTVNEYVETYESSNILGLTASVAYAYDTDVSEFKQTLKNASNLSPTELIAKLKSEVATLVYGNVTARQWAHVIEFGALGLAAAAMFLAWLAPRGTTKRRVVALYITALVFCAGNSVFDQLHKLFVPGREFDVRDLFLDLAGYAMAVSFVFVIYALGKALFGKPKAQILNQR